MPNFFNERHWRIERNLYPQLVWSYYDGYDYMKVYDKPSYMRVVKTRSLSDYGSESSGVLDLRFDSVFGMTVKEAHERMSAGEALYGVEMGEMRRLIGNHVISYNPDNMYPILKQLTGIRGLTLVPINESLIVLDGYKSDFNNEI